MTSDAASQNEANPLKDLSRELELLQKQRLKAIDSCQFSKAKTIDVHIERLKERIKEMKENNNRIQNILAFELKKEEIQYEAIRLQTDAREYIFNIRQNFQKRQMTLIRNHTDALTQVADGYSSALEIETLRHNPTSEAMVRQAKLYAKEKNYATAESLFNESNFIRESSSQKRQEEVDKLYEGRKNYLEKKHQKDIELCEEKEYNAIDEVIQKFYKDIAKLKNILLKSAFELNIQVDPQDVAFLDEISLGEAELGFVRNTPKKTPQRTPQKSPHSGMRTPNSTTKTTPSSIRKTPTTPNRSINRTPASAAKNSRASAFGSRTTTPRTPKTGSIKKQANPSKSPKIGLSPI